MLFSERYKRIYSPQSSPIDSAGFISTVSSLLDAISKSAPQSAQVMISPIIASCGNLISPAQSLHSVIKYFPLRFHFTKSTFLNTTHSVISYLCGTCISFGCICSFFPNLKIVFPNLKIVLIFLDLVTNVAHL
jgi:hypothetical protein